MSMASSLLFLTSLIVLFLRSPGCAETAETENQCADDVVLHRAGWGKCERCGGSDRLGAHIEASDVLSLEDTTIGKILDAIRNYGVVVIPKQNLTRSQQVRFTSRLGEVVILPASFEGQDPEPGEPAIQRITNFWADGTWKGNGKGFGAYWHQDGQFWPRKFRHILSILYAEKAPLRGGQTGFADLWTAQRTLSKQLRDRSAMAAIRASVRDIPDFVNHGNENELALFDEVEHPILDSLPYSNATSITEAVATGEATLFVGSPQMRTNLANHSDGAELLRLLFEHATAPSLTYYHHWNPGDIVIWDNVQTLHHAFPFNNDGTTRRELFRTQARLTPTSNHVGIKADEADARPRWLREDGTPVWVSL